MALNVEMDDWITPSGWRPAVLRLEADCCKLAERNLTLKAPVDLDVQLGRNAALAWAWVRAAYLINIPCVDEWQIHVGLGLGDSKELGPVLQALVEGHWLGVQMIGKMPYYYCTCPGPQEPSDKCSVRRCWHDPTRVFDQHKWT
jgi:hypothetical protein